MNIHGAHNYRKPGALGAAGVRRVWAGAGPQRAVSGERFCRVTGFKSDAPASGAGA